MADLGLHGCSLSVTDAPLDGAAVNIKIGTNPRDSFVAHGIVVHSRTDRAGIAFESLAPASSEILTKWLAQAKFPTRPA